MPPIEDSLRALVIIFFAVHTPNNLKFKRYLPRSLRFPSCRAADNQLVGSAEQHNAFLGERDALISEAETLARRVQTYLGGRGVEGAEKLSRAIRREVSTARKATTLVHLQGVQNNLYGFVAEVNAATSAPAVVAVRKRFPGERGVEVDVVALGGAAWIEVKFASGTSFHFAEMKQQVHSLIAAASLPRNYVRHTAPIVCVLLAGAGWSPECEDEVNSLRELGVVVADNVADLPAAPPPLNHATLCVTSLCALCSEVTNGGAASPEVRSWAQQNRLFGTSVDEELREPLLLASKLSGFILHAREDDVAKFETILSIAGGPRERDRWFSDDGWKSKIRVHPAYGESFAGLLGLAGKLRAVVVTANSKATRSDASQNVSADFLLHRPRWIAGV